MWFERRLGGWISALGVACLFVAGCSPSNGDSEAPPAGGSDEVAESVQRVESGGVLGLVRVTSAFSFDETAERVQAALDARAALRTIAVIDHSGAAASIDLELRPTRLFIFGNPALGAPLMDEAATLGLDLPQKMLVVEDDTGVYVAYNDPGYLGARHGLGPAAEPRLEQISTVLAAIAREATRR